MKSAKMLQSISKLHAYHRKLFAGQYFTRSDTDNLCLETKTMYLSSHMCEHLALNHGENATKQPSLCRTSFHKFCYLDSKSIRNCIYDQNQRHVQLPLTFFALVSLFVSGPRFALRVLADFYKLRSHARVFTIHFVIEDGRVKNDVDRCYTEMCQKIKFFSKGGRGQLSRSTENTWLPPIPRRR